MDTVQLDVGYAYDTSGRLSSLTTPSGQVIGYSYSNGRISGVTVNQVSLLSQVSYRPFGPTTGWQWGNGSTTVRQYDTDGQLTLLNSAGSATYSYFADGLIRSRTDDVAVNPPLVAGSKTFSIDSTSNRVASASGLLPRSYSYDAAGNTLGDGSRTFTYGDSGRMVSATSGGVTTDYRYSGLGERVKKSSGASTRYFEYDESGQLIGEYDDTGGLIQETVWLGDIPVATLRPDGSGGIDIYYVHTDHLNTPRRVTRPIDDTIIWRWDSVPFGATAADEDPDGDMQTFTYNLRFPGQYYDEETGLHYNYYRTYDPSTGRYLESDPIGLQGGLNTYSYVGSMPTMYFDPLGLTKLRFDVEAGILHVDPENHRKPYEVKADSGKGDCMNDTECEFEPNEGPIPRGDYYIDTSQIQDPGLRGDWRRNFGDGLDQGDWGDWRVRIYPYPHTVRRGRTGFYLHGGLIRGSSGCIQFRSWGNTRLLRDLRRDPDGTVELTVE